MKYWLSGALSLFIVSGAWAQDYNVVSSPSLKLDIWIDNIKNNSPDSWCGAELPLRIVANDNKKPEVLKNFLPRVGSLLARQCKALRIIHWQMNDSNGALLAHGSASKARAWAVQVETTAVPATTTAPVNPLPAPADAPATVADTPSAVNAAALSPSADTTPWTEFSLMDGCHFRTYWRSNSQTSALFVPAKGGVTCGDDGWLSGESQVTQIGDGATKNVRMTFLQGFPVSGLNSQAVSHDVQITTVNNERMVLADEKSPQSWMVVPYAPLLNGWQTNGTVVVQISRNEASDDSALQARLDEVRKVWSPYLINKGSLSFKLVEALHPQLKDPAAGAFRTIN